MILVVFLVSKSFGFFNYEKHGETRSVVSVGGIKVTILNNSENNLDLLNAYPMPDSEGLQGTPIEFNIENVGKKTLDITLKLENNQSSQNSCVIEGTNDPCTALSSNLIRYAYKVNNGSYSEPQSLGGNNNIIFSDTIEGQEIRKITLVIWIDSTAGNEIQGSYFFGNLIITGEKGRVITAKQKILSDNEVKTTSPTLTTTSQQANENGLYVSYDTNSGDPTYYFRGNVDNNYVDFAGMTWRIVRINEDGTIRLILDDSIDTTDYKFNNAYGGTNYMYYSNSDVAKSILETWYQNNVETPGYGSLVATGNYFCEAAKVKWEESTGDSTLVIKEQYNLTFNCNVDSNNKQYVSSAIGLINYDEVAFAGGAAGKANQTYYLYTGVNNHSNNYDWWTMSPAGYDASNNYARLWTVADTGYLRNKITTNSDRLRPVINLKSNVKLVGTGTVDDKYTVTAPLNDLVLSDNTLITVSPTLTTSSNNSADASGLYKMSVTNGFGGQNGDTYYFRGNVTNNFVEFADKTWRIVRINEDGTIRLILDGAINNNTAYKYSPTSAASDSMYFTTGLEENTAQYTLNAWYSNNIQGSNITRVASGNYFCEKFKVSPSAALLNNSGLTTPKVYNNSTYQLTLECTTDNNHGLVNNSIGALTAEEVILAGGYPNTDNDSFYLYNTANGTTSYWWTMSPAGVSSSGYGCIWYVYGNAQMIYSCIHDTSHLLRPVINLKADTFVSKDNNGHYVVVIDN